MNSNGYITAPISLKDDVYGVLGIAPSGAYYDVAEACTSSKINKWSKYKPYITSNNSYEAIPYNTTSFVGGNVTVDPSASTNATWPTFWGLVPSSSITDKSGKSLREFLFSKFQQFDWIYLQPVKNTNWMRLTDFEYYRHNISGSQPPVVIEPNNAIKDLINSYGQVETINLFPKANFTIQFKTSIGNYSGFNSVLEFFQKQPNLRFAVEIQPTHDNWQSVPYPGELLGKWFSKTLSNDPAPGFMINIKDFLNFLYGVDNYWHMGTDGGTINFFLGFQEANGDENKELFYTRSSQSVVPSGSVNVTTDPSKDGTILPSPGYVGYSGNPGFHWALKFGCWFDRKLTNFKWGYKGINAPQPTMREGNSTTSGKVVGVNNRNLYIQCDIETKAGEDFYLLSYNNQTKTQDGVWFAAVCENADNKIPVVATVFSSNNESAWYGDTSQGSDVQIMGEDGKSIRVYLRFNNFWEVPYSQGCRIKLYVSLAKNPTTDYNSQDFLKNWFAADEFVYFPNGSQMGNYLQTDVYYLEK